MNPKTLLFFIIRPSSESLLRGLLVPLFGFGGVTVLFIDGTTAKLADWRSLGVVNRLT